MHAVWICKKAREKSFATSSREIYNIRDVQSYAQIPPPAPFAKTDDESWPPGGCARNWSVKHLTRPSRTCLTIVSLLSIVVSTVRRKEKDGEEEKQQLAALTIEEIAK